MQKPASTTHLQEKKEKKKRWQSGSSHYKKKCNVLVDGRELSRFEASFVLKTYILEKSVFIWGKGRWMPGKLTVCLSGFMEVSFL